MKHGWRQKQRNRRGIRKCRRALEHVAPEQHPTRKKAA